MTAQDPDLAPVTAGGSGIGPRALPFTSIDMAMWQHTLERPFLVRGIGLHTGMPASVHVEPAPAGTGRVFLVGGVEIPALLDAVVDTRLATTLGSGNARITMVEHLLAAMHAAGVDNARIHVDGPEVPVLDGSARTWVAALHNAGLRAQARRRSPLTIRRAVRVESGDSWAELWPASSFEVDVTVDFPHPHIGRQTWSGPVTGHHFYQLAAARTFGFRADAERLWASGLARGASLENTVVYDDDGVLNPGGLRSHDEAVRHKALDAVGDAALLGAPIHGRLRAYKAGHALHKQLFEASRADN